MSEMLERVAKAIELAQGNAPYYVMPQYKNKAIVYEIMPPMCVDFAHSRLIPLNEAEDLCEKLNGLWIARKAIEALKPASDDLQNKYFEMTTNEGWTNNNACFPNAMWERAIDTILSDDK